MKLERGQATDRSQAVVVLLAAELALDGGAPPVAGLNRSECRVIQSERDRPLPRLLPPAIAV
jgi:hypothetical protein